MKLVILIMSLFIVGCAGDAQVNSSTSNSQYHVGLLFEHEGCKVYRFLDGGRYIYYTNCKGSTQYSYQEGKVSRLRNVSTDNE